MKRLLLVALLLSSAHLQAGPVAGFIGYWVVKLGIITTGVVFTPVAGPIATASGVAISQPTAIAVSAVLTATPFLP